MAREITDFDAAELRRLRMKVDNLTGPGVVNTPTSIAINPPISTQGPRGSAQGFPLGQYEGTQLTMVSQLQAGWSYPEAVDMGGA